MISTLAAFAVTLGILIAVHEFGHFWVARRMGVRVLRFSLGFGPVLFSRKDRQGTAFSLSLIPLGGYVRFADERDPDFDSADLPVAYNRKPVWRRMLIVAAGPAANFLLAILVYWAMNLYGVPSLKPDLGVLVPDSVLASMHRPSSDSEHLRLLRVDDKPVQSWQQASMAIAGRLGTSAPLDLHLVDLSTGESVHWQLPLNRWLADQRDPDPLAELGLRPWHQAPPPILGSLVADGPAERAGLREGDRVLAVNGQSIQDWAQFVDLVQNHQPANDLSVQLLRQGVPLQFAIEPEQTPEGHWRIGVALAVPEYLEDAYSLVSYGPLPALGLAFTQTQDLIVMSLRFIQRMITGNMSVQNLSGPVSIAHLAGETASYGLLAFVNFLAFISISLGIVNLLPIPALDGGHLVLLSAEAVRGKPLPARIEAFYANLGLFFILLLMSFAIFNDIHRFWG